MIVSFNGGQAASINEGDQVSFGPEGNPIVVGLRNGVVEITFDTALVLESTIALKQTQEDFRAALTGMTKFTNVKQAKDAALAILDKHKEETP